MIDGTTVVLVRKARTGDPDARDALIRRYYEDWVRRFHGDIGSTVRKLYDTHDLVQSAVADAIRGLPALRDEAVFSAWVTSIIRHKIAVGRRRLAREVPIDGVPPSSLAPGAGPAAGDDLQREETYIETLDAILGLFPDHPEEMAALVLKLLDGMAVADVAAFLGASERTAFRRIENGIDLLRRRLRVAAP
jgi:RNA polymerase sigma factor (sigma-70 family)